MQVCLHYAPWPEDIHLMVAYRDDHVPEGERYGWWHFGSRPYHKGMLRFTFNCLAHENPEMAGLLRGPGQRLTEGL